MNFIKIKEKSETILQKMGEAVPMKKKIMLIVMIVLVLLSGIAGYMLAVKVNKPKEAEEPLVDVRYVTGKLDTISELTTAELTYTGLIRYEDGDIPILTKKGFSMIYTATAKAGIDFSEIDVKVSEKKVVITLPQADILSVQVDSDSIQFYDEQYALLNPNEKTDITDTISMAEADVYENMDVEGLREKANNQTKELVTEFLKDAIGDRELEVMISQDEKTEPVTEGNPSKE